NTEIRINAFGARYFEPAPERNAYAGVSVRFNLRLESRRGRRSCSEHTVGVIVHVDRSRWRLRLIRAMWVRRREA
ncbi:MAG: hypothetical protein V3S94_04815, partial [Gammaproteobacteria bacterium]